LLAEGIGVKDEKVLAVTGHRDQIAHAVLETSRPAPSSR